MSEQIVHISDDNFEADVLQSDKPVLVDFWAEWMTLPDHSGNMSQLCRGF